MAPAYLSSNFRDFDYCTRDGDNIHLICPKSEFGRNSLQFKGVQLYNLPSSVCHLRNLSAFKRAYTCVVYFCSDFSCMYLTVCVLYLVKCLDVTVCCTYLADFMCVIDSFHFFVEDLYENLQCSVL